jgi:hypothetical protein
MGQDQMMPDATAANDHEAGRLLFARPFVFVKGCVRIADLPPPDPTQALIFNWMPVFFTFMLGSFPAGLVIYWAWNNTLSITQQYIIMRRHGAPVDLFGNILTSLGIKRASKAG